LIEATLIDYMGTDLSVVNAARVSFGKKSSWAKFTAGHADQGVLQDKDRKLIHYLAEHKHLSPFGHCFASFHVKAPLFVARQLVKHKFLRWNEISRRYVDSEPEFYLPENWRAKANDKKQGSGDTYINEIEFNDAHDYPDDKSYLMDRWFRKTSDIVAEEVYPYCMRSYKELIDKGVCPEQARMVLPQSTMTEWYWSGSLDAFADMCNLRCTDDTQLETRLVADEISADMKDLFPIAWEALVL